jgi:hypothetical protein
LAHFQLEGVIFSLCVRFSKSLHKRGGMRARLMLQGLNGFASVSAKSSKGELYMKGFKKMCWRT